MKQDEKLPLIVCGCWNPYIKRSFKGLVAKAINQCVEYLSAHNEANTCFALITDVCQVAGVKVSIDECGNRSNFVSKCHKLLEERPNEPTEGFEFLVSFLAEARGGVSPPCFNGYIWDKVLSVGNDNVVVRVHSERDPTKPLCMKVNADRHTITRWKLTNT